MLNEEGSKEMASQRMQECMALHDTTADLLARGHIRAAAGAWADAAELLMRIDAQQSRPAMQALSDQYREAEANHPSEWEWMVETLTPDRTVKEVLNVVA